MVSVMSVGLYALLALQIGFLIQLPFCFAFSGIFTSYELSLTVGSAWVISIIPFPHPLTIPISSLNITTITTMPEPRNLSFRSPADWTSAPAKQAMGLTPYTHSASLLFNFDEGLLFEENWI